MRVLLKFTINCDADAAWRALHSPSVLAELYAPLLVVQPMQQLPTSFESGTDVGVRLLLAGLIPVGQQQLRATDRFTEDSRGPVRILRDSGIPLTGPLAGLDVWDHQMAVSPAPDDPTRTLWRDRLVFAGPSAALLWPTLWAAWQWRAARIRSLAPGWAYDPPAEDSQQGQLA